MPRLTVPVNLDDHRIGTADSPATLVEYGDYQCLTCRMGVPVIKQLKKELGEKMCFAFRHFPLAQTHPTAKSAAVAAEAASRQNKFWEMHELLYQNQLLLSADLFHQLAAQLNLNLEQFETDLHSPAIAQKIDSDFQTGLRSGVNGTPCFYINGERYDGDPSYEGLKHALVQASES